jgi:hypothetical protein
MKKLLVLYFLCLGFFANAQVGIGTENAASSAILDVTSTTRGLLPPRMTTTERDAISAPATGLMIFNTTTNTLNLFNGSVWFEITQTPTQGQATINTAPSSPGILYATKPANSVSSTFNYTSGNSKPYIAQSVASTGVTGLTASLVAGTLSTSGSLVYTITGTPSAGGTATFALNFGGQAFTLTRSVLPIGTIATIDCAGATQNGNLTIGVAASGVSSVIPYTGGNAGFHDGQTLTSTGVTGLTATFSAGNFANGNGSLTYTITGTPASAGTASFAINIGGKTCTLTRTVSSWACGTSSGTETFVYDGASVTYGTLVGAAGKCWLDRNLGATYVAGNSIATNAYGDYFQWGRGADGHQKINSTTTPTLSSSDQPVNNKFIYNGSGNVDWRDPQNNNLWSGVNGTNNPCPSGYRLPTLQEFEAELSLWAPQSTNITSSGSFASLKLPLAGYRGGTTSPATTPTEAGTNGVGLYWTSTIASDLTIQSNYIRISSSSATTNRTFRVNGYSVRCIKNY